MDLQPLHIGTLVIDPVLAGLVLAGLAVFALLVLVIVLAVHLSRRKGDAEAQDKQLGEMRVRLQTLAEISVTRHGELARAVNERLDRMSHKVGSDLNESTRKTHDSISRLNERLAVIDTAQKNLTELSSNMVSLQQILANKQARGAFGQMRMEAIIKDGLPAGACSFQTTLSNGKRPDCLLRLPNTPAGVVIDAKFPLEGFEALRTARSEEEKKLAARRIRTDVGKHIEDIAAKYFIPGETQDTAILFVPSESISADLSEYFPDIVQKAHRARIFICAPNMLMLAVQTIQAILKDVQMREQAHLIQHEVAALMGDMGRFRDRIFDLQRHFGQANADIEKIVTSADKISKRGQKIENLDFEEESRAAKSSKPAPAPTPGAASNVAKASHFAPHAPAATEPRPAHAPGKGPRIIRQPDPLAGE